MGCIEIDRYAARGGGGGHPLDPVSHGADYGFTAPGRAPRISRLCTHQSRLVTFFRSVDDFGTSISVTRDWRTRR